MLGAGGSCLTGRHFTPPSWRQVVKPRPLLLCLSSLLVTLLSFISWPIGNSGFNHSSFVVQQARVLPVTRAPGISICRFRCLPLCVGSPLERGPWLGKRSYGHHRRFVLCLWALFLSGFELRALCLQSRYSTAWDTTARSFCILLWLLLFFFFFLIPSPSPPHPFPSPSPSSSSMGSCELFVQAALNRDPPNLSLLGS
jgi:hypothetical protein